MIAVFLTWTDLGLILFRSETCAGLETAAEILGVAEATGISHVGYCLVAQAVPDAYPNKTVLVLKNLGQMAVGKTVVLVIEFCITKGLAKN